MTESDRSEHEIETELLPEAGAAIDHTLEMPVHPPQSPGNPPMDPLARLVENQAAFNAIPQSPGVPPPTGPSRPAGMQDSPAPREAVLRRPGVLVAGSILAAVAVVAAVVVLHGRSSGTPAPTRSTAAATPSVAVLPAKITSFDPSGRSGFKHHGQTWRTETYKSAKFGRLKDGVGLLLDLGAEHRLSTVSLDAGTGPITVELRSADQRATALTGYQRVGESASASGPTTLQGASGGAHRYWLIWVTMLGPRNGGFGALLGEPVVRG